MSARDPRERPRRGDVLSVDGMTITVEHVKGDGTDARKWSSAHTEIHCRIEDPSMPKDHPGADFRNYFSPMTWRNMVRRATVVKAWRRGV